MLGKISWYSIDVSRNDRHILFFYKKYHFCHLLPFAKVGQKYLQVFFLLVKKNSSSKKGWKFYFKKNADNGITSWYPENQNLDPSVEQLCRVGTAE